MLSGGSYYAVKLFSEITEYKGSYDSYNDFENPPERIFLEETFTAQQIEQHIITYLEQHHEYFFDGSEYDGLDIPYESWGAHIRGANNCFSLSIYEPENNFDAWTISKCSDDPDPILQGLCDIMETNFMSVFED